MSPEWVGFLSFMAISMVGCLIPCCCGDRTDRQENECCEECGRPNHPNQVSTISTGGLYPLEPRNASHGNRDLVNLQPHSHNYESQAYKDVDSVAPPSYDDAVQSQKRF